MQHQPGTISMNSSVGEAEGGDCAAEPVVEEVAVETGTMESYGGEGAEGLEDMEDVAVVDQTAGKKMSRRASVEGPVFSNRWVLMLSIMGNSIGTGNLWRFPRIAAVNAGPSGAGVFIVSWICFLFLWSVPILYAEYSIGRYTRRGVVSAFPRLSGGHNVFMALFIWLVNLMVTSYYTVVTGWSMFYLIYTIVTPLPETMEEAFDAWNLLHSYGIPVYFQGLSIFITAFACIKGAKSIEKFSLVLVPLLIAMVFLILVRAVTLEGAHNGVAYLLYPDYHSLVDPGVWLAALSQNAWDTGAGMGLLLAYATFFKPKHPVVKAATLQPMANNTISLVSGISMFAAVFGILKDKTHEEIVEVLKFSGPAATGLTFIWVPQLFAKTAAGRLWAILFFLALLCGALTSLMAMIETSARTFSDPPFSMRREFALIITSVLLFFIGLPSALSLDYFSNQDYVWGTGLLFSGLFMSVVVIRYGASSFRRTVVNICPGDWSVHWVWDLHIMFWIPIEAAVLLISWAVSAIMYTQWYHPFVSESLLTCLMQWGIGAIFCLVGWLLFKKLQPKEETDLEKATRRKLVNGKQGGVEMSMFKSNPAAAAANAANMGGQGPDVPSPENSHTGWTTTPESHDEPPISYSAHQLAPLSKLSPQPPSIFAGAEPSPEMDQKKKKKKGKMTFTHDEYLSRKDVVAAIEDPKLIVEAPTPALSRSSSLGSHKLVQGVVVSRSEGAADQDEEADEGLEGVVPTPAFLNTIKLRENVVADDIE